MTVGREQPVKVLYIGGYSRSGSTLLLRAMGEASGVVAVGELINIWSRGYLENQLCGCGEPFRKCEFWNLVSNEVFNRPSDAVPADRVYQLQRRIHSYAAFPKLWLPFLRTPSYRRDFSEYAAIVSRLYRAIGDVSGAHLIADSSKLPQFARMLTEVPGVETHLIHLVRDSRATAFSWQRSKVRTEIHWTRQEMAQYSVLRSSVEWDTFNFLLGLDRDRFATYTMVRYEDLVRAPGPELASLAQSIAEPAIAAELASTGQELALKKSHTVSGNPSRFESGKTQISVDDEWVTAMPKRQRVFVTAATAPLLRHYGYLLSPPPRSRRPPDARG
jgi:Sulfotransferase family